MSLPSGIYEIRKETDLLGDIYATGLNTESPILGLPIQDTLPTIQKWDVRRFQSINGEHTYVILKSHIQRGPLGGFGLEKTCPGASVIFRPNPAVWYLRAKDPSKSVYSIVPKGGPEDFFLALDIDNQGAFQPSFALQPYAIDHPEDLPGWEFRLVPSCS